MSLRACKSSSAINAAWDAEELAAAVGPSPAPDLLSKVGDGRIANFGCPHCGRYEVGRCGRANGRPRYRCKECRKTFGPLRGTPLAGLHYKDHWMDQAQALMSGESVVKAAERAINRTTAFRWRHRFLSASNSKSTKFLGFANQQNSDSGLGCSSCPPFLPA